MFFAMNPARSSTSPLRVVRFSRVICVGAAAALFAALGPATALAADTPEPFVAPARVDRLAAGRAAIQAADWKKAISELTVAVREQPRNADAHNLLGYASRKQARPDLAKAFEHYGLALKLDPNHKGAHEYIGEAYLMDKQPAKAEEHLLRLRAICGGSACEEYEDLAKAMAAYRAQEK
jgi:Flp pilus assembly protein TadD